MRFFELTLGFAPSFNRSCTIHVEGSATGSAVFEAPRTGLLPRLVHKVPVNASQMEALLGCCTSMFASWDDKWRNFGLDGISVSGSFDETDSQPRSFDLWSPRKGSIPHSMVAAALDCVPLEHCCEPALGLLEDIRSYFELQAPATIIEGTPTRVRFAPSARYQDVQSMEQSLAALPQDGELIIDISGLEWPGPILCRVLPMARLLNRPTAAQWLARHEHADILLANGVVHSNIEFTIPSRISRMGEPIVLGGLFVPPEFVAAAAGSTKIDVVRAFRHTYGLPLGQAARAAEELIDILAAKQA